MTGNAVLSLPLNANLLSSRDTAAEHGVKKQYRRLTRTWASAVLTEVLLQLRGVQAVRNLRNVRETHGARWIDVPGFAKDLYTTCDRPTRVCGRHRMARRQSFLGLRGTLPPGLAPVMRLLRIENTFSRVGRRTQGPQISPYSTGRPSHVSYPTASSRRLSSSGVTVN